MNRREMLAAGGLTGVALGTGCAPRMIVPGGFDAPAALSGLDRSLAQTSCLSGSFSGARFACGPGVPEERVREAAGRVSGICSEGARALTVTAFFQNLAPEERLHPDIQARMHEELPRIGKAVTAMADAVEQVGPQERKAIQEYLRQSPGLEDRILSEVDGYASRSDAPFAKRVQFQRQLGDLAWRMRHQSADVVIDEVLTRFRKGEAYQRAHADELRALAMAPAPPPVAESILGQAPAPSGSATPERPGGQGADLWWLPGTIAGVTGLGTMGLGVVVGMVSSSSGNIGGATAAVLLVALGLLVLVISLILLAVGGAIRLASGDRKSEPPPAAPAPSAPPPEQPPPAMDPL